MVLFTWVAGQKEFWNFDKPPCFAWASGKVPQKVTPSSRFLRNLRSDLLSRKNYRLKFKDMLDALTDNQPRLWKGLRKLGCVLKEKNVSFLTRRLNTWVF